jgi:hypothetical protein
VPSASKPSMSTSFSVAGWWRKWPAAGSPPPRARSAGTHANAGSRRSVERVGAGPAAAAAAASRARAAADDRGAASCCSAGCTGAAAASPLARPRCTTRGTSWVTWAGTAVCSAAHAAPAAGAAAACAALLCLMGPGAAAPARRARCLRVRAAAALPRPTMQDLPRVWCTLLRKLT